MATDGSARFCGRDEVLELFSERVREHLAFLGDLGYQGPKITSVGRRGSQLALKAEYDNLEARRRVSVSFQGSEEEDHAGIAIWRLPIKTYRRDLINFPVLIWSRLPDVDQERLSLHSYTGTLGRRLDALLNVSVRLLRSEALDILMGEAWEEGLHDG